MHTQKVVVEYEDSKHPLSNFYELRYPVYYSGQMFKTVENALCAAFISPVHYWPHALQYLTPQGAQSLTAQFGAHPNWEKTGILVLENLIRQKLCYNPEIMAFLKSTKDCPITIIESGVPHVLGEVLTYLRIEAKDFA